MKLYTDAPTNYDGFGTRTIAIVGRMNCGIHYGKPVRLVETPDEHAEWQRCRYESGCAFAATEAEWPRMNSVVEKEESP